MSLIVKIGKKGKRLVKQLLPEEKHHLSYARRIERVKTGKRLCAMTFDDGPMDLPAAPDRFEGRSLTDVLLDTLAEFVKEGILEAGGLPFNFNITNICDGIGALVAVILVSRLNSGQPQGGTGWEFKAVIASVMGGASLSGGKGNAIGVALGAIFVGVLENGMTLLNISSYHQQVVQGVVLILAIMFDVYKNRRLAEAK